MTMSGSQTYDGTEARNRRLRRVLLAVAAFLAVFTIVYIALHRHD